MEVTERRGGLAQGRRQPSLHRTMGSRVGPAGLGRAWQWPTRASGNGVDWLQDFLAPWACLQGACLCFQLSLDSFRSFIVLRDPLFPPGSGQGLHRCPCPAGRPRGVAVRGALAPARSQALGCQVPPVPVTHLRCSEEPAFHQVSQPFRSTEWRCRPWGRAVIRRHCSHSVGF